MTNLFIGFAVGAVTALFSVFCLHKARVKAEEKQATSPEQERLNAEKKERADRLAELNRQFDNMMNYKGEEQR